MNTENKPTEIDEVIDMDQEQAIEDATVIDTPDKEPDTTLDEGEAPPTTEDIIEEVPGEESDEPI